MRSSAARVLAIAQAAWQEDRARPKAPPRRRDELEFLPAAIEVLETPASPAGRAMTWVIMGFFAVAVAWACIGTVDVVAVAQGKIVPSGRSKVIQPMETGIVNAINVEDGQAVKAGDVLVELDPTATDADQKRLASELMAARLEAARLKAIVAGQDAERAFEPPVGADPTAVQMNRALMLSAVEEQRARLAAVEQDIARKQADRAGAQAKIVRLEKTLPMAREQSDARTGLAARGYYSRLSALDAQQKVIEQEQDLVAARAGLDETNAGIAALQVQRRQVEAEFRKNMLGQLTEAEKKVATTSQDLLKAQQRNGLQTLIAPIDGIVQQLAVHTVGGVVTPAQQLLVVVPVDEPLEVEAMILNRDIGFIAAGQDAKIKLETFQFTKYGTIPGHIKSISRDAVQDQSQAQLPGMTPTQMQAQAQTPGQKLGLVYPARITLDRTQVDVDGRPVPLGAGMAVTVEIKTESRRLIEYLLSPILRYRQESMHER